jgi:hypothetical protein
VRDPTQDFLETGFENCADCIVDICFDTVDAASAGETTECVNGGGIGGKGEEGGLRGRKWVAGLRR